MNRYYYKARDRSGRLVTGEVEALTIEAAARVVKKNDLIVISIKPSGVAILSIITSLRNRITQGEVATFTRQLSIMVNAGLAVTDAISILREQSQGNMKHVLSQVLADVEGGESLSAAFSKHPKVFSPIYVALIKSAEVGGVLDEVLARMADSLEKQQEFRGKVQTALIYPGIIVSGMIIVAFIMMVFIIPKLTSLYEDFNAQLPLPTKILIFVSQMAASFWPVLIILGFFAYSTFRGYRKTIEGRRKTDELLFKIPIIGDLQRQVILTDMTRTLPLMISSGVSILESLNVTAGVVSNVVISDALRDVAAKIEKGFPVAYAFARHPEAFPFLLSQMIAVGEETGKMDEVLVKISHVFEVESDQKVKALTTAIEPFVMVILGLGVGFLVIAVILPIYNLTSQF